MHTFNQGVHGEQPGTPFVLPNYRAIIAYALDEFVRSRPGQGGYIFNKLTFVHN
jgi:hypothetical protein